MTLKVKFCFSLIFLFFILLLFLWKANDDSNSQILDEKQSEVIHAPNKSKEIVTKNAFTTTHAIPTPPATNEKNPNMSDEEIDELDSKMDINFETWLINYGQSLNKFEIMSYFFSPLSSQQKNRLLDFWFYETSNGYEFLSSQNGMDFLSTLLSHNPKDVSLAKRVGFIMTNYSRMNDNKLSDEAEERFQKSSVESEKIAMAAVATNEKFLRNVIFNHKESIGVRAAAAGNFLAENKEPGELKKLLELSETQPKLQNKIIISAITSAGAEDLDDIFAVLKDQGMAKDQTAILIGRSIANNGRMDLIKSMDADSNGFQRKVVEAFHNRNKEIGVRYGSP